MIFTIFGRKIKNKMVKTIIVDDEHHVRVTLGRMLKKHCPHVKVIGEAESVLQAHELILRKRPDLILLDIHLGDGNGFDLIRKFETPGFKIIFITAHDQYALQAFKVSAVDYILKPITAEALIEAVTRAGNILRQELLIRLDALESNLYPENRHKRKIVIKTQDKIYLENLDHITHLDSDGTYTRIFTTDTGEIMTSKPLKEYEEMLVESGFFRVYRSYLINLAHISRFDKNEGGYVILTNKHQIPVASRKREELLELFEEFIK
ncbi:MAG: two-component system LytT family response [Bacteroidetes bacterium]|nr:MAG: two-component system LytT family response [Bacteroidota bacterium]